MSNEFDDIDDLDYEQMEPEPEEKDEFRGGVGPNTEALLDRRDFQDIRRKKGIERRLNARNKLIKEGKPIPPELQLRPPTGKQAGNKSLSTTFKEDLMWAWNKADGKALMVKYIADPRNTKHVLDIMSKLLPKTIEGTGEDGNLTIEIIKFDPAQKAKVIENRLMKPLLAEFAREDEEEEAAAEEERIAAEEEEDE